MIVLKTAEIARPSGTDLSGVCSRLRFRTTVLGEQYYSLTESTVNKNWAKFVGCALKLSGSFTRVIRGPGAGSASGMVKGDQRGGEKPALPEFI